MARRIWCRADASQRDSYKLREKDLSPTRFAVGKAEIDVRMSLLFSN